MKHAKNTFSRNLRKFNENLYILKRFWYFFYELINNIAQRSYFEQLTDFGSQIYVLMINKEINTFFSPKRY